MAETTSAKEKEPEAKTKPDPETDAPPTPEATPAINAPNAAYLDGFPNWSDPPELAEGEVEIEGSLAQPLAEDWEKDRDEVREEERKRVKKAIEENDRKAKTRADWEEKQARKRKGATA